MMKRVTITIIVSVTCFLLFAHKKDPDYLKARRNGGDTRIALSIIGDDDRPVSDDTLELR